MADNIVTTTAPFSQLSNYSCAARNLLPNTLYTVGAIVSDSYSTAYGANVTFRTLTPQNLMSVSVIPNGSLILSAGGTQTLTASTVLLGFNRTGDSFDGEIYSLLVQPDGKVLVGADSRASTATPPYQTTWCASTATAPPTPPSPPAGPGLRTP
jgi:hypothetical protein